MKNPCGFAESVPQGLCSCLPSVLSTEKTQAKTLRNRGQGQPRKWSKGERNMR